jgi:hypothetical protein
MSAPVTPSPPQHRSAVSRFFRNPETGAVVVAQPPNLPLWVWLVSTAVRMVLSPDGALGVVLSVVGTLALLAWAALELTRGDSPFRRVLGAVVLVAVVAGLLLR